jgi:hypothetical protein
MYLVQQSIIKTLVKYVPEWEDRWMDREAVLGLLKELTKHMCT